MRALLLEAGTGADGVVTRAAACREAPTPERAVGEVLVRVRAGSLNRVDLYMRASGAGITHQLPLVMGVDGAGEVAEVGPETADFSPGDRVVIYPGLTCGECEFCRGGEPVLCVRMRILGEHVDGAFRDYLSIPRANLFTIPEGLSFAEAATLPTAYLTAWRMIVTKARVQAGEDVLIFGVGGGVSLAAMRICRWLGARTIVTSGSDEKLVRAKALGADVAINHRDADVVKAVMAATDGRGVDVVVDNVGQATWGWGMRSVVRGGRIVCCGATSGGAPSADLQRLFIRQIQVLGSTLGNPGEFADLLAAVARHGERPPIDRTYPLSEGVAALDHLESGAQFGKLVLTMD